MEERTTSANEAMLALTELSPSERLRSVRSPLPVVSEAFDERKTATVDALGGSGMSEFREALGSLDPRAEVEDAKTEAVEALRSLDPRPALREAVDESAREHVAKALAAPLAVEGKQSVDARPTLREVLEEGKERTVEAAEGLAVPLAAPNQGPGRSTS